MQELRVFLPEKSIWYIPKTFGLLFVGMLAARQRLFERLRQHATRGWILAGVLLGISLGWELVKMDAFAQFDLKETPGWRPVLIALVMLIEALHSFGYIVGFGLLFQRLGGLRRLLAKVGRMALSNYLLQSLMCVLIFCSYGLGFYGKLRPTDLVLLSVGLFGVNVVFSVGYLKRQSVGPLEALWRRLSRR